MSSEASKKVLALLPDAEARHVLERASAGGEFFEIEAFEDAESAARAWDGDGWSAAIVDAGCLGRAGAGEVSRLVERARSARVFVVAREGDERAAVEAWRAGAAGCLYRDEVTVPRLRARLTGRAAASGDPGPSGTPTIFRRLFEVNSDAMLLLDGDGRIELANPAACRFLGSPEAQLVGEIFPVVVDDEGNSELEVSSEDGENRVAEIRASRADWNGRALRLVVLRDVTERKRVEQRASGASARALTALDALAVGVVATDADGRIALMNAAAEELTGLSRDGASGRRFEAAVRALHPDSKAPVASFSELIDTERRRSEGANEAVVLLGGEGEQAVPTGVAARPWKDRDASRGTVFELRRAVASGAEGEAPGQRDVPMNLLAGGIAHDFNNILTAILGNLSVLRMDSAADDAHANRLAEAEKAALQAKQLTQQLLTFSKGGAPLLTTGSIGRLLEDSARFILRGSNVRCEVERDPELWEVEVDRGQICQVVNNLVVNADQAMPEGGTVTLRMRNASLGEGEVEGLPPGSYLRVEVSDDGCGIAKEHLDRIFEAYFTTKEGGNGLGLASCKSIVASHGGLMRVASEPGEGTAFFIYLPRAETAVGDGEGGREAGGGDRAVEEEEADAGEAIAYGTGRLLVMDDMEAMMTVAGEMLGALGYEVEFSRDGAEAIETYKKASEEGRPFDAVVFDLTVPGGMGGEEACRRLREYDPNLKAIASSGYSNSNVMSDFRQAGFQAVVPKPYRIREMSHALRRILQ